jgi:predicted nucleic acid-binding protein
MALFFDTSALFKRYQREQGTAQVSRLLERADGDIFISTMTIVEVISNLKRLCSVDRITTEAQFGAQRAFFYHDIETLEIVILDIAADDIIAAENLILKRYMKPIDSLQLAIALNLQRDQVTFVSADRRLCAIAVQEGLRTIVPQ